MDPGSCMVQYIKIAERAEAEAVASRIRQGRSACIIVHCQTEEKATRIKHLLEMHPAPRLRGLEDRGGGRQENQYQAMYVKPFLYAAKSTAVKMVHVIHTFEAPSKCKTAVAEWIFHQAQCGREFWGVCGGGN